MPPMLQAGESSATNVLPPAAPDIDRPPMSIPPANLVDQLDLTSKIPALYANHRKAPKYRFLRLCGWILTGVALGLDLLGLLLVVDAVRASIAVKETFLGQPPLQGVLMAAGAVVTGCMLHVLSGCSNMLREINQRLR